MKLKLFNEYWVKAGFFTLLKNVLAILLGFGAFYFLVRVLDKHSFGAWCLFLGTTTLIEFARNGLVSNALIRYLSAADEEDYGKILSASFAVTAILTAVGIVINCSIAHWLSVVWKMPEVENLFYYYNIIFILTGVVNLFNCIQQANLNFKGTFFSSSSGALINFVYVGAAYFLQYPISLMAMLYLYMVGAAISFIISAINTRSYLRFTWSIEGKWVKTLLNYGKFSFGTIISALIFSSIDQWMLGFYISAAAAGAFNIAARVTNMVEVPTGTIAAIVFPQSARRMATEGKEGAKYLYEKSVGVILAFLLPAFVLLFIFSEQVIDFIAGDKYAESIPLLRVTILYCLLVPFSRQFGTILDSIGKARINFVVVIISALCNVLLNYFFIRSFGIIGAAYGTLCASIINFTLGQVILKRVLNVNVLNTFKYAISFYPECFRKYIKPAKHKSIHTDIVTIEAVKN